MASNLFVSYRLNDRAENAAAVVSAIESLGSAVRVQDGCWYAKSRLPAPEAATAIWHFMRPSDSLVVVDATEGEAAWRNLSLPAAEFIKEEWAGNRVGRLLGSGTVRKAHLPNSGHV